jgi:hydrogenase nickel incorporation protein HypA/HybF
MHELSIAISLVEAAEEEAARHEAARIHAVHLRLGALSGVQKDALLFSYGLAAEGTSLQGSQLIIEDVPAMVFCETCRERRPIRSLQSFCCASCGAPATDVVQGRDLEVFALEIQQ